MASASAYDHAVFALPAARRPGHRAGVLPWLRAAAGRGIRPSPRPADRGGPTSADRRRDAVGGEAPPSGLGRRTHRVRPRRATRRAHRPVRGEPDAGGEGRGVGRDRRHRSDRPGATQGGPRGSQDHAAVRAGAARRGRGRRHRHGLAAALGPRGARRGARPRRGARHRVAVLPPHRARRRRGRSRRPARRGCTPTACTSSGRSTSTSSRRIRPSSSSSPDLFRALAFRALGGDIAPGTDRVLYAYPALRARASCRRTGSCARRRPRGAPSATPTITTSTASCSASRRAAGCSASVAGVGPEPLSLARRRFPEPFAAIFPNDATALMARRAEATVGLFRSLAAEFEPYGVHVLAKLGLATRSGEREHLWFEVHELRRRRPRRHARQPADRCRRPRGHPWALAPSTCSPTGRS